MWVPKKGRGLEYEMGDEWKVRWKDDGYLRDLWEKGWWEAGKVIELAPSMEFEKESSRVVKLEYLSDGWKVFYSE